MANRIKNTPRDLPPLSRLEQRVMGIVWNLGECGSSEVIEEFNRTERLAESTIRTVLANLRKKGYVELVPTIARQHRFRPAVSRENVGKRTLRDLVSGFFGGSPRQVLSCLIKEERLSDEDLEALRKLIEEQQGKGK
ncbi:MAG: BlaI/MecI/CopY family transcriptional regulator [Candidatus Hydrogenedentes bacterium]|nr:BlaI/MecI/CopY family transcriptional regulator [Candidatus Hydrogenedentota bacterium]